MPIPKDTGFYWARWMIPSDDVADGEHDYTPGPFEPVELCERDEGVLVVEMLGTTPDQPPENFYWGPRIVEPARIPADIEPDRKLDRAIKRFKDMTLDERIEFNSTKRGTKIP